jgi:CDGSH-type Zn-finger protein
MTTVTITVRTNGPYLVDGEISLVDQEGNPIPIPEGKKRIALCRCGASATKPFCDATHSKIGFKGANEAARKFDEGSATG